MQIQHITIESSEIMLLTVKDAVIIQAVGTKSLSMNET